MPLSCHLGHPLSKKTFFVLCCCCGGSAGRLTFLLATTRPLVADLRNCRFFSELENFARKETYFGVFFDFLGRAAVCAMWGGSWIPTISNIVFVIGVRGGSWDEILKTLFPNGDTTTCTYELQTGRGRWQVGACQLIISRS